MLNCYLHFVPVDTTVVKFAPLAFMDPYRYIGMNETTVDVKKLHDFMMDKTTSSEYLAVFLNNSLHCIASE